MFLFTVCSGSRTINREFSRMWIVLVCVHCWAHGRSPSCGQLALSWLEIGLNVRKESLHLHLMTSKWRNVSEVKFVSWRWRHTLLTTPLTLEQQTSWRHRIEDGFKPNGNDFEDCFVYVSSILSPILIVNLCTSYRNVYVDALYMQFKVWALRVTISFYVEA